MAGRCLVTEQPPIALRLHPAIRRVAGALRTGSGKGVSSSSPSPRTTFARKLPTGRGGEGFREVNFGLDIPMTEHHLRARRDRRTRSTAALKGRGRGSSRAGTSRRVLIGPTAAFVAA